MSKKHSNFFITAAMEDLAEDLTGAPPAGAQTTDGVSSSDVSQSQQAASQTANQVTQTDIDSSVDAVAMLMEQNTQLATENDELSEQTFDNDTDAIEISSDSANKDLEEAVQAGIALENLSYIADLAVKTKTANQATVAALALGLESICYSADIKSPVAALEDDTLRLAGPAAQTNAIGETAKSKSKEIVAKLVAGVKRIIGWIIGVIRNVAANTGKIAKKAGALKAQLEKIDESAVINNGPFIASLRLVEGGGDANKQFEEYVKLASKTLYGFFNDSFVSNMKTTVDEIVRSNFERSVQVTFKPSPATLLGKRAGEITRMMLSTIFTEHGTGADVPNVPANVPEKELTVGLTPEVIGGNRLFLATTVNSQDSATPFVFRAGLAKNQPKFETPENIPVVKKAGARAVLQIIERWMGDQEALEARLKKIESLPTSGENHLDIAIVGAYLQLLSGIATSIIPHFLRLNVQNAARYVAYVDRSIAASTKAAEAK